jgi:hypothetical protein
MRRYVSEDIRKWVLHILNGRDLFFRPSSNRPADASLGHTGHIANHQLDRACAGGDKGRPIGTCSWEGEHAAAMVAILRRLLTDRLHLAPAVDTEHCELLQVIAIEIDGVRIHGNVEVRCRPASLQVRHDRDLAALVRLRRSSGHRCGRCRPRAAADRLVLIDGCYDRGCAERADWGELERLEQRDGQGKDQPIDLEQRNRRYGDGWTKGLGP